MAQEGSEASVASSSTATSNNWWEIQAAATAFSSWGGGTSIGHGRLMMWPPAAPPPPPPPVQPQPANHPSNSSGEEDLSISNTTSFTNATSNHSGLSVDSSSADLPPPAGNEPVENMWSQVLYNVGNSGGLQSQAEDAENFLEAMAYRRSVAADQMFDPACDYLKKMDGSWEYANQNNFKHLSNYNGSMIDPDQRLANNLSDFVSSWSIAPPNAQLDHNLTPSSCNISMNPSVAQYSASNIAHIKHEASSYPGNELAEERRRNAYNLPFNFENQNQAHSLLRPAGIGYNGYFSGLNSSFGGLSSRLCAGVGELPLSSTRSLSDLISFSSGCLQKPVAVEVRTPAKPHVKGLDSSENYKKQGYEVTSSARGKGRSASSGTTEGKKKRSEDGSETLFKKPKNETSTVSSLKTQPPKIKLGEKITALQQLVSPFGKTDTASVLLETINVIRILQEQVQLLSDPYMKSSSAKDHNSWGDIERKEKSESKLDLRSKGLCLIPVSCIPQSHRENSVPDYWMQPTYRSCLYR